MRNLFSLLLLISIFLISCRKKDNFIIPENTFKDMLIDLHLADGIYMMDYGKYYTHNDSINYYNTIFKSYGYTRAHFDSTLHYYTTYPQKFEVIYDDVVNHLKILEQQISQLRNYENDSIANLFKGKTKWQLPLNSAATRIPFDIAINDSADYTINVYARKHPDDQSKNLRITAFFWYKDSVTGKWEMDQFPEIKYTNNKFFTFFTTSKRYASKRNARLRGWILNTDKQKDLFKKHIEIKMVYIDKKILLPEIKVVPPNKKKGSLNKKNVSPEKILVSPEKKIILPTK